MEDTVRGHARSLSDSRLQLILDFARRLTLAPARVRRADYDLLLARGLSRAAILDAVLIIVGFNLINRVADALHFKVPGRDDFALSARFLRWFGYRFLVGFGSGLRNDGWIKTSPQNNSEANHRLPVLVNSTMRWLEFLMSLGQATIDRAPEAARRISAMVMNEPSRLSEHEVQELQGQGCSDPDIFGLVISGAAAASLLRLKTPLDALHESLDTRSSPFPGNCAPSEVGLLDNII